MASSVGIDRGEKKKLLRTDACSPSPGAFASPGGFSMLRRTSGKQV